jgi:hypothetical protein
MLKFTRTRRQRQALIALAVANGIVVIVIGITLVWGRIGPREARHDPRPESHQVTVCREAVSDSLFDAGLSGLVHIDEGVTIRIEFQQELITNSFRLDADGVTWAALEAIANRGECRRLETAQVSVKFSSPQLDNHDTTGGCQELMNELDIDSGDCTDIRTVARVAIVDVMTWALGAINDQVLSTRVDYRMLSAGPPNQENISVLP